MFQKGDTVGLLEWSGYGKIIHVLDNDCYLVFVEDADMEVPLHKSELYVTKTEVILGMGEVFNIDEKVSSNHKKRNSSVEIIDLHIERIPIDFKRNRHDLEAQMAYLEHYLQYAVNQKKAGITIIHGKGNGVLKSKLTKFLREKGYVFSDPERELDKQQAKLFVKLR